MFQVFLVSSLHSGAQGADLLNLNIQILLQTDLQGRHLGFLCTKFLDKETPDAEVTVLLLSCEENGLKQHVNT